ncbi:TPA: hypothetical protein EYO77_12505 [Candidatus Poribacteria bacterium]|jgi:L-alanine-DL-glutamate epimerase-like enolase superfamily enzyme|nr:hypothetical protein [Candidatus Poribacteria bacterium]HIM10221.1 hypothetical protein [Candidatus Poribacteria bacterium]HIO49103.1 hypothetical protein [Candidatus Poribacteria bacterium]
MVKDSDIRILDAEYNLEKYDYRTPLKFGGVPTDHCVIFNVKIRVRTRDGGEAEGLGSMPLGNVWAFPPKYVPFDQSLEAMKTIAKRSVKLTGQCDFVGHPVDISEILEVEFLKIAEEVSKEMGLGFPVPKLCTAVTTSPIDAAIHDGFGKANGINSYHGLSLDYMNWDLSHYLNDRFSGKYLDQYVLETPQPRIPLYHLVGALDPLTDTDIPNRLNDGLPETLPEWIVSDGLTHLKIKLNGSNLDWDVDRVLSIEKVAAETQANRGIDQWFYSADFNETCQNVEYLLEFLAKIEEGEGNAFNRLAYIEQPTDRDLKAHPENKMHQAAKIKPVVIDESLTDFETFLLARDQGYSGVALKACKGQSQALLMGAAAQEYGMFLAVQDLTCPGSSFLHSAGIAARVKGITAIEGNGRQFCPIANEGWKNKFPSVFMISDGTIGTYALIGNGLGH